MTTFENIIFDLDGTLVDSAEDIMYFLKEAYLRLKISAPHIDHKHIGPPLLDMIRTFTPDIPDEDKAAVIKEFRRFYDRGIYPKTKLYEGVYDMLRTLFKARINLFLATNKPHVPTKKILRNLNIDFFDDIITPDTHSETVLSKTDMVYVLVRKWALKKAATTIVGDSEADVIAAHSNNITAVSVLYGYGEAEKIRFSKPDYIASTIEDLHNLLMGYRR